MSKALTAPRINPAQQAPLMQARDPALAAAFALLQAQLGGGRRRRPRGRRNRQRRRRPRVGNSRARQLASKEILQDIHVHECTAQYASALADAEGTPQGACVPWGFPVATQRFKVFQRSSFVLNASGIGFVTARFGGANDVACMTCSNATSVGGTGTTLSNFTLTTNVNFDKLPFSNAQMAAATMRVRLVAFKLKARYSGNAGELNGTVASLEAPANVDLGALTPTQIRSFVGSVSERPPVNGDWHTVSYSGPNTADQADMSSIAGQLAMFNQFMTLLAIGNINDAYEVEAWAHYEYAGNLVPGATMSHSDPSGYGSVVETTKSGLNASPLNEHNAKETLVISFKPPDLL